MTTFPFTALVGQEELKLALILNAVDPAVGGVLICGEKGTAKSTAARGLADLLPPIRVRPGCPFNLPPDEPPPESLRAHLRRDEGCQPDEKECEAPVPFVELPLGATEDRVVGTLDFERALSEGRRVFQPGLLAAVNRGILYVDEVNLLADHLVDLLLDAAASGTNVVQREGIEVAHPAKFQLIGTMNPEEGQLRPQLLDRFGLMVEVAGPAEAEERVEIVRRRLAFEADPDQFAAVWQDAQRQLRDRILAARSRVPAVVLSEDILRLVARVCGEIGVDGMRADITLCKAARALAALESRLEVINDDVRRAAEFVLPHRRRRQPFERPGLDRRQLDDLLSASGSTAIGRGGEGEGNVAPHSPSPPGRLPCRNGGNESARGEGRNDDAAGAEPQEQVFAPREVPALRLKVAGASRNETGVPGRRSESPGAGTVRFVRALPDSKPQVPAIAATLRAAVRRQGPGEGRLQIDPCDLHRQELAGKKGTLIVLVVDASGSMAARRRMEAVKGAVLSLLADAYRQRDRVAVIAFRGTEAQLLLSPTRSVETAQRALERLPTGGRTPLAHALELTSQVVGRERQAATGLEALVVLLTDGRANVPLPGAPGDAWQQTLAAAARLAAAEISVLLLDTEFGVIRQERAAELAAALGARYLPLDELTADSVLLSVRRQLPVHGGVPAGGRAP